MISKSGLYVLKAVALLARIPKGSYRGASAVAETIGAPPNYLSKLLQSLVRSGLLESRKGLGGGFRLARSPKDISVIDVVGTIDQLDRWSECLLGGKECSDETACAVHSEWKEIRIAYIRLLENNNIADLINSGLLVDFLPVEV